MVSVPDTVCPIWATVGKGRVNAGAFKGEAWLLDVKEVISNSMVSGNPMLLSMFSEIDGSAKEMEPPNLLIASTAN